MAILMVFSFLAGMVTILSPCILPLLPVILSGSVGGGKKRPFGIILGFIGSFSFFTLTLSILVDALGFSPDLLRNIAAVTILIFGLVMVVPKLKELFSLAVARLLARRKAAGPSAANRNGLLSGLVLGLGLGVLWTPCVGPIMASVISLALSHRVDSGSVFIILSYAAGTAIPLLLIMLGGRRLLTRFSFFSRNAEKIQRSFGVLMVLSALALFTGADRTFQNFLLDTFPGYGAGLTAMEDNAAVRSALDVRSDETRVPGVEAGSEGTGSEVSDPLTLGSGVWINSPPLTLAGLKGKVVLVDFWTYSCINCIRTLPYLRAWHEKYGEEGLVIIGVHSPEFAFEKSEAKLRKAMTDLGVTWPVVQDNDFGIWRAYSNRYWPAHYFYDREGTLVATHFGEGSYRENELLIRKLLADAGAGTMDGTADGMVDSAESLAASSLAASSLAASSVSASSVSGVGSISTERTPETYLGYGRGKRFSSPEAVARDRRTRYSLPPAGLDRDRWAFEGPWTIEGERSIAEDSSSISLYFNAAKVYLVISPLPGGATEALVTVDGLKVTGGDVDEGVLSLSEDRLYTLFDGIEPTTGIIRVEFNGRAGVYAFTFG